MKLRKTLLLVFTSVNFLISQNLQIGGYVQSDDRIRLKDKTISWEEYRLGLTGQVELDKVKFYSEVWIRNFGSSGARYFPELSSKEKVEPINIDVREAYVDVKGFIYDNLDLRIGRQRIAWGTADKLNPTDNLNPDDLEDIWDFGRHLGSNAIKLSYYLNDFSFTGVFIPTFTPAVLPKGDWVSVFAGEFVNFNFPYPVNIDNLESIRLEYPKQSIKDGSKFGFKISKKDIFGFDVSLSYVVGRDDIPVLHEVRGTLVSPYFISIAIIVDSAVLSFPKMRVFGFDFTGDIGGIGVWGEAGVFYPSDEVNAKIRYKVLTDFPTPDTIETTIKVIERKSYTKFVLGADYTFSNGLYVNVQYLHGFLHERRNDLRNYVVFNFEKKYVNDKLKVNFLSGGFDFKQLKEISGWVYNPQITYAPIDNFEIAIGGRIIGGDLKSIFGRLSDRDEVYLRVKYSF